MLTFADLVDHIVSYGGSDATRQASQSHRLAVLNAYTMLPTIHDWSYFWKIYRIATSGSYNTGTVEYDHTGGAIERQLTLSGGTWPTWASLGHVRINDTPFVIQSRVSGTVLQLSAESNPGADLAAGTTYTLLRDTYSMPENFVAGDEIVTNEVGGVIIYVHPRDWSSSRRVNSGPGRPQIYTYTGDITTYGRQVIHFWPPTDTVYNIDLLYRSKPRAMVYDRVEDGTVSVSSSGTTVTGVGTRFLSAHVGSVIRFANDALTAPTGQKGLNPFIFETLVTGYTSPTSITIQDAAPLDFSGVAYTITDPCDLEPSTHEVYFLRECEAQFRLITRMDTKRDEAVAYDLAIERAREADQKNMSPRAAMRYKTQRSGLKYHPRGPDA